MENYDLKPYYINHASKANRILVDYKGFSHYVQDCIAKQKEFMEKNKPAVVKPSVHKNQGSFSSRSGNLRQQSPLSVIHERPSRNKTKLQSPTSFRNQTNYDSKMVENNGLKREITEISKSQEKRIGTVQS